MIGAIIDKTRLFVNTHNDKIVTGGILLIAIPLLFGICAAIYSFLRMFFPKFVCILILIFLGYRTLYFICQKLTFPGSLWLWRRNLENIYGRATASKLKEHLYELVSLSNHIMDTDENKCWPVNTETSLMRDVISSMCELFMKQEQNKTLSRGQKLLAKCFEELRLMLQKVNVVRDVSGSIEVFNYWTTLIQELDLSNTHDMILLTFENMDEGKQILEICAKIIGILDDLVKQKNGVFALYRWLTNDSLGSLDQIREQLAEKFEGKQIYLKVASNVTLDCMLLPGYSSQDNYKQYSTSRTSSENDDSIHIIDNKAEARFSNPTIIFCNPNASYYELIYFDNYLIDFYLRKGVNVFVWNYRGYGRSAGKPSPSLIKSDGEQIVKFLQTTYNVKKIGAHGQSLGGSVVCHLAKHANLDYACADRTFSSLANVAAEAQGFILGKLYLWVTGWSADSSKNFADANCYKILTFDPKDDIIPYLASLRNGVTNSVIETLAEFDSGAEPQVTPKRKSSIFSSRGLSVMKLRFRSWFQADSKQARSRSSHDYHEILTPSQISALYFSLRRLSELFFERSKVEAAVKNCRNIQTRPKAVEDYTLSASKTGIETSTDGLKAERFETEDLDEASPIRAINPSPLPKKLFGKDDLSLKINETDRSLKGRTKTEFPTSSQLIKSYLPLLQEGVNLPEDFKKFIPGVFATFSILDSGGITLIETLAAGKKGLEYFRDFILSFEIWGSYYPYRGNTQEITQGYRQKRSIMQIQQFLQRLEILTQNKPSLQGDLEKALSEDLEVISTGFSLIHQKLNLLYDRNYPEGIELTTYGQPSPVKVALQQGRAVSANQKGIRNSFLEVGHLLPLTCGHNGYFSKAEMLAFESYFMSSDFVKL